MRLCGHTRQRPPSVHDPFERKRVLGEGFDCPQLDALFLAFPVSFKGRIVQYAGRLLRSHDGKTSVRIYDYADVRVPVLRTMHVRRLRTYKSPGFTQRPEEPLALAIAG